MKRMYYVLYCTHISDKLQLFAKTEKFCFRSDLEIIFSQPYKPFKCFPEVSI